MAKTLDDVIKHLSKIRAKYGNIRVYEAYDGEFVSFDIKVQEIDETYSMEWRKMFGFKIGDRFVSIGDDGEE